MSTASPSNTEQTTQHPLEVVVAELDVLLEKLRMELDVAPTDLKAHQDLLHRIIQASKRGLQIPFETYPHEEVQEPSEKDLQLLESEEWIAEGKIGQEIDIDAINHRLKKRGYQIQSYLDN